METLDSNEKLDFETVWKMFKETDVRFKDTNDMLNKKFSETDVRFKETDVRFKNTNEMLNKKFSETDELIKELGKQIGGLGNKFGTFNEGLVMPSLKKLFLTKFNCPTTTENFIINSNGDSLEIDLLAISDDECYIIEIKSHLKHESIKQIKKQLSKFKTLADIYKNRRVYGVLAATHFDIKKLPEVYENGLYFISIADDLVSLQVPDNFKPKIW